MMGGSCASSTRRCCLQQDNLLPHIEKGPAKDGTGWSTPSPSCPLLWLHRVHKLSAGIAGSDPRTRYCALSLEKIQELDLFSSSLCGREKSLSISIKIRPIFPSVSWGYPTYYLDAFS